MSGEHGHGHTHGMTGERPAYRPAPDYPHPGGGACRRSPLALIGPAFRRRPCAHRHGCSGPGLFATRQAERPANASKTYGYHRTGILAALANAVTLIGIVVAIAYEAIGRFQHPQHVQPGLMFLPRPSGIAVNLYIASGFHKEGGANLNVRAAMLHVLGDVGASAGVIVGGLVILLTGWMPWIPLSRSSSRCSSRAAPGAC